MTLCELLGLDQNAKHATLDIEVKYGLYWTVATLSDIVTSVDGNTVVVSPGGVRTHGKVKTIASAAKMEVPDLSTTKVTIELGEANWAGTTNLVVTVEGCGQWNGRYCFATEDLKTFGPHNNPSFTVTKACHLDVGGWAVKLKPK